MGSYTEGSLAFEQGFFSLTDHAARYGDLAEIAGDTIQLSRPWEEPAQSERALSMGRKRGEPWPSYGDEGGGGLL